MYYVSPGDESAQQLKSLRESGGIDAVIEKVCKLDPHGELAGLIREKEQELRRRGWIRE